MTHRRLTHSEIQHRQRVKSGLLDQSMVARIKWLLSQGASKRELAADYDVSLWTIRAIARGDTWAWVEPDPDLEALPIPKEVSPEVAAKAAASLPKLLEIQQEVDQPSGSPSADAAEAYLAIRRAEPASDFDRLSKLIMEGRGSLAPPPASASKGMSLNDLCLSLARLTGRTAESLKTEIEAVPPGPERNALVTKIRKTAVSSPPPASSRGRPSNALEASAASAARVEKMLGRLTEETHDDSKDNPA